MKLSLLKSPTQWKDSMGIAFAILAAIETILGISGIPLNSVMINQKWWEILFIVIGTYLIMVFCVYIMISFVTRRGISIKVNGITVKIQQDDLFMLDGWKVIPFNEFFDTTVDEDIIVKSSLNGEFILKHVDSIKALKKAINTDEGSLLNAMKTPDNRYKYPLGRIKRYGNNFMLLAFTHTDEQKMARINMRDYFYCLMNMWKEISRTYANRPVCLPLLGSGITRFDDMPNKCNIDLLKCMIFSLKASGENINQTVTIVLSKEVMSSINIYEVKGIK